MDPEESKTKAAQSYNRADIYKNSALASAVNIIAGIPKSGKKIAEQMEPTSAIPHVFPCNANIPPIKASIPKMANSAPNAIKIGGITRLPLPVLLKKKETPPIIKPRMPAIISRIPTISCFLVLFTRYKPHPSTSLY